VAVGYDNIDVPRVYRTKCLPSSNTPGVLRRNYGDFNVDALMAVARGPGRSDRLARSGAWGNGILTNCAEPCLGQDALALSGRAHRAGRWHGARRDFAMRLNLLRSTTALPAEVEREIDAEIHGTGSRACSKRTFLSLHVPCVQDTPRVIGPAELVKMKRTAFS